MTKMSLFLYSTLTFILSNTALAGSWSSPEKHFSLNIPTGWVEVSPHPLMQVNFKSRPLLLITPVEPISSAFLSGCSIYKLDHSSLKNVTQAEANATLERWDQGTVSDDLHQIFGRNILVTKFTTEAKGGIRVVSAAATLGVNEELLYKQVQFMLAVGDTRASFFTASCFSSAINNEILKTMNDFLSSLLFTNMRTTMDVNDESYGVSD